MRVDLELLAHAVGELDEIARGLEREVPRWDAPRIERDVLDPGSDPVSVQLGVNMRTMAGRAGGWLAEYAAQVRAAHAALEAQLESYRAVEQEIAGRMRRS
jgi:hypothetical protein